MIISLPPETFVSHEEFLKTFVALSLVSIFLILIFFGKTQLMFSPMMMA